jgi:hypothetical protein
VKRKGDDRPFHYDGPMMKAKRPIRWLPRHGDPTCVLEFWSQQFVKWAAHLPVYTAIIVTLTLIAILIQR